MTLVLNDGADRFFQYHPPAGWLPLPHLGLIRATGPEARSFLQSQLTNDAAAVSAQQGQLTGYCSPKGRLLAVFSLLQLGPEDFLLSLPASLLASTLKRLKMFVLRSKLTLSDASVQFSSIGLIGPHASEALRAAGFAALTQDWACAEQAGLHCQKLPGPLPRYVLHAAPGQAELLIAKLELPPAAAQSWLLAEVLAGTPQVLPETVDHFVPQSVDLDRAGGVSFTKGCYPGQEIVARVHYLGRVKQGLFLSRCPAAAIPATPVFAEGGDQAVGEVLASAASEPGEFAMLISLNLSASCAVRLDKPDGPALSTPQRLYIE